MAARKTVSRSVEEYRDAVQRASSGAQALRFLNLVPSGGNYAALRDRIKTLGLDTSHWTGKAHLRGRHNLHVRKIPIAQILVEHTAYRGSSSLLKSRLLAVGLLSNRCAECHLTQWRDLPIALHLDHINGIRDDNRLENLRLLCPNCHSQTPTYCGRNKGVRKSMGSWMVVSNS